MEINKDTNKKINEKLEKEYGPEKGKEISYAMQNEGKIPKIDKDKNKKPDKIVEGGEQMDEKERKENQSDKEQDKELLNKHEEKEHSKENDENDFEELNKEMEALKSELEELRNYKSNNESDKLLSNHNVKNHLKPYVSKIINEEEDKESALNKLKKEAPELFKNTDTNISSSLGDYKTPPKDDKDKNKKDLKEVERKLGY